MMDNAPIAEHPVVWDVGGHGGVKRRLPGLRGDHRQELVGRRYGECIPRDRSLTSVFAAVRWSLLCGVPPLHLGTL